eukprot:GHVU01088598.1.p1 GENE.GHVU01088598.1~~GHVU01088598.1.p1  ORF type:complete len:634 (-),score=52.78 GHVU01088598.1:57-1958(-)
MSREIVGELHIPILWEYVNACVRDGLFIDLYDVLRFFGEVDFESVEVANDVLVRFMYQFDSPLGRHGPKEPNRHGDTRIRRVCNIRMLPGCKCTVTVVSRKDRVDTDTREITEKGYVRIEWNGIKHHHDLIHPKRMQVEIVQAVDRVLELGRDAGLRNLDTSNRVSAALTEFSVHKDRRDINGRRRRVEAAVMDELRLSETEAAEIVFAGTDVDPPMSIPASETESEFRDVMGALAWIQKKQPDAFINVAHENGVLSYVFLSLLPQRVIGSLFGELRCVDDRHDVSHQYMKLAVAAILTSNGRMEPAACAFMSASDIRHWRMFVLDSIQAFETNEGGPVRRWDISLADQDGSISGAVRSIPDAHRPMYIWTCFWHFIRALEKKFRWQRNVWSPLVERLKKLLLTDSREEFEEIAFDLKREVAEVEREDLKGTISLFVEEVVDSRSLAAVNCWSNAYTSQSLAESASSLFRSLGTSSGRKLGDIVRTLAWQMLDGGGKHDSANRTADTGACPPVHTLARELLTSYAFRSKYLPEFEKAINYEALWDQGRQCYSVTAIDFPDAPERIVRLAPRKTCDCNRTVWGGVCCRHIIAVSISSFMNSVFSQDHPTHVRTHRHVRMYICTAPEPSACVCTC